MSWLVLFGAAAALQPITLHCQIFDEGEAVPIVIPGSEGWDARIKLLPRGKKYESAIIDGPPIFSSSRGLVSYSSSGASSAIRKTTAKAGDWKVRKFAGRDIKLQRGGTTIDLIGDADTVGASNGQWAMNELMDRHVHLSGGGAIACQTLSADAPTNWDNYRP